MQRCGHRLHGRCALRDVAGRAQQHIHAGLRGEHGPRPRVAEGRDRSGLQCVGDRDAAEAEAVAEFSLSTLPAPSAMRFISSHIGIYQFAGQAIGPEPGTSNPIEWNVST